MGLLEGKTDFAVSGLEISQNRHLPCITKNFGIYGKNIHLHWKSSKVSLALQPEVLVNTSGRVDFSSPVYACNKKGADQPEHPCSLISVFVICSLESIIATLLYTIFQ